MQFLVQARPLPTIIYNSTVFKLYTIQTVSLLPSQNTLKIFILTKLFQNPYTIETVSARKSLTTKLQSHALAGCHATGSNSSCIFCLHYFTLLIFIIQNRNSNIINSFWIKVVKIIIIKINIIKGYTINVSDLSKNC